MRERIPLSYSVPFGEPKAMAEYALERVGEGHRTIKVKVGNDPARDVEAVARVREAIGPDVRLRVDANMAWPTAKEAIRLIRAMEPWDLELVEQPLPPRELDAMAEVRRAIGVPLMADESVRTPRDAMEVIRRGAADIANVYVTEAGGLLNASRIFTLCEAAGMPCMIGSMPEFGIGTAAQIHLGVAMTNLGPGQRHLRRPLSRRGPADPAAPHRGRLRLSARGPRPGRRDRPGRARALAPQRPARRARLIARAARAPHDGRSRSAAT